jgi:septum formation protein
VKLILASASPARLETLRRAGVEPEVVVSGVDEDAIDAASPAELALTLATAKMAAVRDQLDRPALVLGCDSVLELDATAFGKPGSADVAAERWRTMRGRSGLLHTGHSLGGPDRVTQCTVTTTVHFADITDAEIELYCATDEPSAVAGSFTIDGLGGWFVRAVEGDPHNVVGLSLPVLRDLLRAQGFELADIGYPTTRR